MDKGQRVLVVCANITISAPKNCHF